MNNEPLASVGLSIWTVYRNPKDAPGMYVARLWVNETPTDTVFKAATLGEVRASIPPGLFQMPAQPGDDPVIVETWF